MAETKKYLDSTGVGQLAGFIKNKVINTGAGIIKLTGYSNTGNDILSASDTLNGALAKLATKITANAGGASSDLSNAINGLRTELEGKISNAVDGVFDYQGQVSSVDGLPKNGSTAKVGMVWTVSGDGFELNGSQCENGDMIVCVEVTDNSIDFDVIQGNWQVETKSHSLLPGNTVNIATVGGVDISVTADGFGAVDLSNTTKWVNGASVKEAINTEGARVAALVTAEENRATGIETGLQTAINTINNTTIPGLKTTLQQEIDADVLVETNRAKAAESTLTTNLNNEITRAQEAEGNLDDKIGQEIEDRKDAITTVTTAVATEKTRAEGKEKELSDRITEVNSNVNSFVKMSDSEISTAVDSAWSAQ